MSISQRIIDDYEAEAGFTRTMLAAVPADKLEWRPHDKSWSLGELAGHLAEMGSWTGAMLEDEMDFAKMPADYKPYVPADHAELLATFEKNAGDFKPALEGRDDDFMLSTWTMRKGEQVLMTSPRHAALRSILLHHQAHHRGQLTVYLRQLDVPVPPTYGPTADVAMF